MSPTTRRQFLAGMPAAALALGPGPTLLRNATRQDSLEPHLLKITVAIPGLDRRLDGLRIGQICDVHVGTLVDLDQLQAAVALMGPRPPEILAVTGDLADRAGDAAACLAVLNQVKAPYGRFMVMGNHDVWGGRAQFLEAAGAQQGTRLLLNEELDVEVQGARLHISGVDFPEIHNRWNFKDQVNAHFVQQATQRVEEGDFRLCLVHHPDNFDAIRARGVELTLAGHTHGGQLAPLSVLMGRMFKYVYGLYREGGRQLYVSGGTGHWLPLRLGVPAEVTEITLKRV